MPIFQQARTSSQKGGTDCFKLSLIVNSSCDVSMEKTSCSPPMFLTCCPHANDAIACGFASGGKISPAQRQIGGDREQLEGRKSQPAPAAI